VSKRVLVAYATKCGSTGEIAVQVRNVLCAQGLEVDVRPAKTVRSLEGYDAIVLGSAIRMGKPIAEARRFVRKHGAALGRLPAAYFAAGMALYEDTPENRAKAQEAAAQLCVAGEPLSLGLFAGKMDIATLEPLLRMFMSKAQDSDMPMGDFRDWEAIQAWAAEVAQRLAA
jgi:menaquinone-dependent protoporphyrinogen oxidase